MLGRHRTEIVRVLHCRIIRQIVQKWRGHKSTRILSAKRRKAAFRKTSFGYSWEKFSYGSRAGAYSLYMAAQILCAETYSPMGCGFCHSIKRASNRREEKSREAHTFGQTGKPLHPRRVSTATPKPRVESSNLSAPAMIS